MLFLIQQDWWSTLRQNLCFFISCKHHATLHQIEIIIKERWKPSSKVISRNFDVIIIRLRPLPRYTNVVRTSKSTSFHQLLSGSRTSNPDPHLAILPSCHPDIFTASHTVLSLEVHFLSPLAIFFCCPVGHSSLDGHIHHAYMNDIYTRVYARLSALRQWLSLIIFSFVVHSHLLLPKFRLLRLSYYCILCWGH